MRGWKNNACLQANTIFLFKFSSILRLSKTIFWVTFTIWKCFTCHSQVSFTCLPQNITGMSMSQFTRIWEATKQRQWKTSLGFCHIPAATCLQEPHAGSPHPSPPHSSHPFLTPMPVLLLFALQFTQFCLYFCFYSPYSLTVFSITSLIFFSLIPYFVFFFIRLNKSVIFFFLIKALCTISPKDNFIPNSSTLL